jgi:hypothetical protein
MKEYKQSSTITQNIQAMQYGVDEEATKSKLIRLCVLRNNEAHPYPSDMMGKPQDGFKGIETNTGWKKITHGDWVIFKNDKTLLISDDIFQLMFEEVTTN